MSDFKLITKALEFIRSEAWTIVGEDSLGESKLPKVTVQYLAVVASVDSPSRVS